MRVLHVSATLAPRMGGPTQAAFSYTSGLARAGVDVELWATNLDEKGSWSPFHVPRVLNVPTDHPLSLDGVLIRYFRTSWPTRFAHSSGLAYELQRSIARFDLIHIHSLHLDTTLQAARAARRAKVPYVVRPHGTLDPYVRRRHRFVKAAYWFFLEGSVLANAAAIHFTTEEEWDLARPVTQSIRGFVVPLALPDGAFLPPLAPQLALRHFPMLSGRRMILFLGRLTRKKGVEVLLEAFALIASRFPDTVLMIAGDDDEGLSQRFLSAALAHGLSNRILMAGRVDGERKRALLALAEVWVLPSLSENFALAAAEAMAQRRPVVISDRVNISREVAAAGAGLVTSPDAHAIAKALSTVLSSHDIAVQIGERGFALAMNKYSRAVVIGQLLDQYEALLANNRDDSVQVQNAM